MANYPITVVIDAQTSPDNIGSAIAQQLWPYSETLEVPPYREFLPDGPAAFLTDTFDGPEMAAFGLDPDDPGLTWPQVAEATAKILPDDEHVHLGDDGRAFQWSTTNPQGRFDRIEFGGRWNTFYPVIGTCPADEPTLVGPVHGENGISCAGGPIAMLDLDRLRRSAGALAGDVYDQAAALTLDCPPAAGWPSFADRHTADPGGYPHTRAQADYLAQPAVAALRGLRLHPFDDLDLIVAQLTRGRDVAVRLGAQRALSGRALVTLDGQWVRPPWIGAFDGSYVAEYVTVAAHAEYVEGYLTGLATDTFLVTVDCHR